MLLVPSVARDAAFARLSFKLQVHWTDGANSMRSGQLLGMQGASSGEDLGEVVVQLDGVYASFDASLRVPPNARYGERSIQCLACKIMLTTGPVPPSQPVTASHRPSFTTRPPSHRPAFTRPSFTQVR
jgi:hypothetical protein